MKAEIILILGNVEVIDFGKPVPLTKGTLISEEANIITKENGKIHLRIDKIFYVITSNKNLLVKDLFKLTELEVPSELQNLA